MNKTIQFGFERWTGWDFWRVVLPLKMQAKAVARILLRGPYKNWDFSDPELQLIVKMLGGTYRVTDAKGGVAPCGAERIPWAL
jgi:hypothetical protein